MELCQEKAMNMTSILPTHTSFHLCHVCYMENTKGHPGKLRRIGDMFWCEHLYPHIEKAMRVALAQCFIGIDRTAFSGQRAPKDRFGIRRSKPQKEPN